MKRVTTSAVIAVFCLICGGIGIAREKDGLLQVWSDPSSVYRTDSALARFSLAGDGQGISILALQGFYFREADVVYRLLGKGEVQEEIVIMAEGNFRNPHVLIDSAGNRRLFWLRREAAANSICYAEITMPYWGHQVEFIWQSANLLQDLHACQAGEITHLVWCEKDPHYQIRYAQMGEAGLLSVETLTHTEDLSVGPAVAAAADGTVHVVWYEMAPLGVEIQYSEKRPGGDWSPPQVLGRGSVKAASQDGNLTLYCADGVVYAAWATTLAPRLMSIICIAEIRPEGPGPAQPFAYGDGARFLQRGGDLHVVWQVVSDFGPQICFARCDGGVLNEGVVLTEGRSSGLYPEVVSYADHTYIYWLKADQERGYHLVEINDRFARTITFWDWLRIDKGHPFFHLLFLFGTTAALSLAYLFHNVGVLAVGLAIFFVLQRFSVFRNRSVFYDAFLICAVLLLVQQLPIPKLNLEIFGMIDYIAAALLPTLGIYLLFKPIAEREPLTKAGMLVIWLYLYQLFALLPVNILL